MHGKLNKQQGFSIIELLVALAIAGVLLGVGLPSFRDFMAHSEMTATNNSLVYSLQLARSSSMERLEATGLCVSDEPLAEDPACKATATYSDGWFVYADSNGNGSRDAGEDILHRAEPPSDAFAFTPVDIFKTQIYFDDTGASVNVAGIPISGTIGLDYGDGIQVRQITVSANGRVTTETP